MESHASSRLYSHTLTIHTHTHTRMDTQTHTYIHSQGHRITHTLAQPHRPIGGLGGGLALREGMSPSSSNSERTWA